MMIREATTGDAAALASIYAAAEGATRAEIGAGPVEAIDLVAWFTERLAHCSIAEVVGVAVGFVELAPPAELRALYVVPSSWGTGVADALHRHAVEQLRAFGAERAWLTVFARNARARRFYERGGWIERGEAEPQDFDGVWFAFVRYELDLARAPIR